MDKQSAYLAGHGKAKVEPAVRKVMTYVQKLKLQEWIEIGVAERRLTLRFNGEACPEASQLDGCYVLKTDLPAMLMSAEAIHCCYKDLAQVEWAFRTFKQGHLEIRPTFVQTEDSTRGHVFVIMLAYLLERELYRCWQDLDITVAEGIDELGSLRSVEFTVGNVTCQKVPRPVGLSEKLLQSAAVRLPDILPAQKVVVATRKKLPSERNRKHNQILMPQQAQN